MKRSFVVVVCSLIFAISLVACGGGGGGGAGTTPAVEQLVNGSSAASTTTSWYCEYDGNTGSSTNANFNIFDLFSDQTGYDAYYGTFTWRTDGDTAAYIALPTSEIRMFDITGTLASGTARYCYNGPTYFNCSLKDCSSGFTDGYYEFTSSSSDCAMWFSGFSFVGTEVINDYFTGSTSSCLITLSHKTTADYDCYGYYTSSSTDPIKLICNIPGSGYVCPWVGVKKELQSGYQLGGAFTEYHSHLGGECDPYPLGNTVRVFLNNIYLLSDGSIMTTDSSAIELQDVAGNVMVAAVLNSDGTFQYSYGGNDATAVLSCESGYYPGPYCVIDSEYANLGCVTHYRYDY